MKTPTSQPLSLPVRLTRSLRTPIWKKTVSSILLACFSVWSLQSSHAATLTWINGSLAWDTSSSSWNPGAVAWSNAGLDTALFSGAVSPETITLGAAITAGGLTFNTTGYNIAGGGNSLTLTPASGFNSPIIAVNNNGLGTNQATISSSLTGTSGFTKTGNGTLRLTANNSATLSGDIAIKAGNVVITNANQLGSTTGTAISVTGAANTTGATGGTGFTGGALVLQGSSVSASSTAGITLNRELSLAGRGPGANNATGALVSIGYNTLAGGLTMGNAVGETRLWATHGTTTVSGPVFVGASAISGFQGNGNFNISGRVSGLEASDDRFYKTGSLIGTTLWLQNASNDFRSTMRVDSGTVRVATVSALGLNTTSTSVDLVNGTLEVRTDAASAFSTKNVRIRNNAGGTIFVDRDLSGPLSLGSGSLQNQTVTFGSLTREAGANTSTWNVSGRNGYSAFFTTATPAAGDYRATTINNNSSGTLTLAGGNVWNANNAIAGGYTVQGGGETIINGAVLASGAAHSLTKGSSGTFTLGSTAATTSTFLGNANLNDGTLAIRSVNALNPTSASAGRVVFGNGALSFLGAESTGAGETWTNKIADLNTANAYILANQSGSAPSALILPNNFAVTNGAAKTLHLGGSAPTSIVNQITGLITNGGNLTNINKFGTSTWEIAAPTSYGSSATLSLAATGATATTTVTLATGTTGSLVVGQPISGVGIPFGTTIAQIRDSTTIILSGNRAANAVADPAVSVGVASGATAALTNTVASAASATPVITVASTVNLVPGQRVTSTNLPASQNWYIRDITSATTVTLVSGTGATSAVVAASEVVTPLASPNFGGNLTIANGTFRANSATAGSDIINSTSNLIFNTDSVTLMGNAGGTFNYVGFAGGTSTEVLGRLIPTAGQGVVSITNGTGADTLTFLDIGTRTAGATLDYQPGTGTINFNGTAPAGSNGIQSGYATFNGVDWVNSGATASQFTGYTAGSGALTLAATTNFSIAGAASTAGAGSINSLKLTGGAALTLGGQLSFTTNPGGVLFDNSTAAASITGGVLGTTANELVVTTNGASPAVAPASGAALTTGNALTIGSTISSGAGALTKAGNGTLILTGANAYTGNTTINGGAIQMSGATAALGGLGTAGNQTAIRQGAILDVNGAGTLTALVTGGTTYPQISIGALTGTGIITNSNAAQSTISLGGTATTGTTTFGGTLQNGTGILNVVINGTAARSQAIIGAQPYTGITVINTGNLAVTSLADGGTASGLGASSNAASNLIFNGGTLTYTGAGAAGATSGGGIYQTTQTPSVSTNRLFTLAGNATIQSSGTYGNEAASAGTGANHASLIFSNTGDLAFVNAGTRTLTLGGSSIGDNEMRIRLRNNPNANEALSLTKADGGLWILNPLTSNNYTGTTTVSGGALRVANAAASVQGLSATSPLVLNGGVLETATSFTRTLGAAVAGTGNVSLTGGASGFAASTTDRLVVTLGGGALTWGGATFAPTSLVLGSSTALGETEITNDINLGSAGRTVTVNNNGNTGTMVTAGILSGVISGGAGGTLTKNGGGVLMLGNANTYVGNTIVNNGNLIVTSIGNATGTTSSSLGASGGALQFNPDADLNGLFYVGGTETATRPWQFVSANLTANRTYRIDASGSGALTLAGTFTNSLAGSAAGRVITLELRGSNTDNNMITSVLSNATGSNTPALAVGKNDGGTWVLNPASANSFTGGITVSGGNLGLTSNGIGATTNISMGNAGIFAFGGALTTSAIISGNNATAVIAGQNNITVGGLTKNSGNNAWTISNNLENGALFTVNGPLLNLETTNNQTINFRGYGSTVLNGVIQNSGGAATTAINIALAPDASFTMAGAANTYSGTTTLTDGILILDKTAAPLGTGIFAFNGGTLRVGATPTNLIGANAITNAVQLNNSPPKVDGAKSIEFSGGVALNASRNLQNELTGGASLTISGVGITNSVASTLTIYGAGNTSISGPYNAGTGVNGLQLSGTGTLALTGTNLATGALTASRGTITLSGTSGGSWNAGTAQVNSGGTLTLDNSGGNNAAGRLFDTGAFTGNGGTLNFINNGTASTETTGALTLNNATTRITMSGAGTGAITFASLATPNTGSTLDLSTISGLGTTNQVIFTAAPTLTGGINTRILINGGADFATHTAGSIGAFTGYNNSNNLNTAAATDTMNLTASAATTANRTVNALKLNGTGLAVTGAASNRLTLTAAGILNTGGNNALSINEVAFAGTTAVVQVAPTTILTVNGDLTGSLGFTKVLGGDLTFGTGARSFVTSTHNFSGGTTTLNGGADTFFPNQAFVLNDSATLNLNGGGLYINTLNSTGVLPGTGGTINGGGALVTNGGGTFAGVISSGTSLGRVQAGTLTFESAQSYTGSTLLMGGTTTFENDATLLNTSDISINHATLSLSNNSSLQTQINNRVGDAIPISLRGGTISVTGRLTTAAMESLGAVSALQGANTITVANGGGTLTSIDLTLASLTRNAGTTINFTGTNLGQQGNSARITFGSGPAAVGSGILGAWAIANTTDYAAYNAGQGVGVVGQGGFTGYDAQVIAAANVAPTAGTFATGNITNIFSTAASSILLGAGTTTTGLLRIGGAFTTDVNFTNNADTLNLGLGGILRSNDNNATTIGTVASRGIITSGTPELVVYNNANTTGATVMTINSSIQGAGTALVKSGAGVLALTGVNTYDGGTTVTQGTLELRGTNTADVVIPAGGLTLNNSTVTQFVTAVTNPTGQGQINATNAVTLRGGSVLTLTGANTLAGLSFDNNGGTATPTVTSGGTLTLTNSNPITVTSSNPSTVATIAGTLSIPSGAQTINTPAIQLNGITVSNLTPTLAISANIISPGASIVKSGSGLLQLSGQNLFNGLTISGGGVVVGASSSPAQGGAGLASGPLGVGSVSMATGTTLFSNSTAAIGNAVSFAGTPTFDTTDNTARTLTLNGAISGAGWTATPTVEVSNPGLTVALLGNLPAFTNITKTGLGTLIFNSTNYSGDYDATALGNPLAISLLHDGASPNIGNGAVETVALGNVIFNAVGTGTITVNRAGGGLPFNQAANKIISVASINTVLTNGLTVANTNGYGLSVLDSGALVGTPTYTVNTATASNVTQGLYMSGPLSGTGFIKAGPGTLVLDNAGNTFSGDITINQGVVSASGNAQLGTASNLIRLAATTVTSTFRATGSYTLTNPIQFTGTANTRAIEVTSGNTLTIGTAFDLNAGAGNAATLAKNDLGTLVPNANNPSWTGGININQGAVLVNNNTLTTPLGTGTITINGINLTGPVGAIGAALQLAGGVTVTNPLSLQTTGNVAVGGINGAGQLENVSGNNTYSGPITVGFDAAIGSTSGTLTLASAITIGNQTAGRLFSFVGAGDTVIGAGTTVTGNMFGLQKFGSGTLEIRVPFGSQTGSTGVQVRAGTLLLNGTGTLNATTAPNLVQSGAILRLDNSGTNTNNRLTGRAVTLQGGTFDFISNNTTELAGAFVSDQGANTINNAGTGTSSLTFASLTQNAGSSLNVTGTFGTATNFVRFAAAPALTPATTGILNRVTVNGNEFASYNATNGIVAFTGYSPATNILGVAATGTFRATSATANSLTGNQTINALTLQSGGLVGNVPNVGGLPGNNPPTTLTITSGSILAQGNGAGVASTLSVPIVAFGGAEAIVHVASGQTLSITSGMSGTAGLSKHLPGTLSLGAQQFISGTTFVNGGTLSLQSGSTNTLLFNNGVAVNTGGTLDLNGGNQFMAGLSSATAAGGTGLAGGTVTNSAVGQSTLVINGNTNFGGVISGNIYLNKTGTGALNLQAPQTYTGPTLLTGGTTTLNDNGALPNTAQPISINYATLSLASGNLYDVANRVNDAAPITLIGGAIAIAGRQQANSSETFGAITLAGGQNILTTNAGGTGTNSLDVTIASLSRSDTTSTIRMNASGQIGSAARLFITAAPTLTNNIIGPWAFRDRAWASYDATYGVGPLDGVGFAGYAGSGLNSNPLATDNVFVSATATTMLSNTTVGTLAFNQVGAAINVNLGGNTLTIQGGGLLVGQNNDNFDLSLTNGNLTSGVAGVGGDFFVHHLNFGGTGRTLTFGSAITNNGAGAVRLILSSGQQGETVASGATILNGVNTYTGGTIVNSGPLTLGATGTLGSGGLTVKNGIFTQTAGGIIPSQALNLGGGALVNLVGNNSLTNLTIENNGGGAPTLNPTGILTLTGVAGITATTSSPGTISTIGTGTLDLNANASFPINVGATIVNGVDVAPWQPGLIITSVIQNGGISKTGLGVLQLGGASTFTGGVTVAAGGGLALASDTNSLLLNDPVVTGPVGTGTLTMGANTTMLAIGGARTITNNVTFLGDTVFNGTNNLTLNGTTTIPSLWNATVTAPQMTVTIGDASPSLATDEINKFGLGTLVIGNYAGTLNIAGGLSFIGDGNTLSTPQSINLGGNLVLAGDTAVTVNRSGSAPNSRNKTIQKVDLTTGNILSVSNQNGYGLEFTGMTTITGVSHYSVANATASNLVQGLTLSGVVSDGGANLNMIKSGVGTLALTNAGNSFGGAGSTIQVLNGILSASSDGALGAAGNGVDLQVDGTTGVGFRSTGTFTTARTFQLNAANNAFEVTAGNVLTLSTPFTLSAATNTLTKNDNGVFAINADNAGWTGAITVNAGALRAGHANALGNGTITVNNAAGSSVQLTDGITFNSPIVIATTGASGYDSRGVIESVSGINTITGLITQNSGVGATIGAAAGATLNINGAIATGNSTTFNAGAGATINLNSVYANGGAGGPTFNKIGTGALNVTVNQPAVAAAINVNQGALNVSGAGVTLGITGLVSVNASGTLTINDTSATAARLGNRAVTIQGGTFNYQGSTSTETSTGALTFARMGGIYNQTASTSAAVTFASLGLGADATANFTGTGLGTAANRLLFTTAPTLTPATTGILSRATVNGADFATYGANGIAAFSAYQNSNNPNTAAATDTMNLTASANLTANRTLNAVKINSASALTLGGAAFNQLTLTAGGILATGAATHVLSVPVLNNAAVQNVIHVNSGSTLNISSTIVGSGGTVKDGAGTLIISSPATAAGIAGVNGNTTTGNVTIARGTVQLAGGRNTLTPNQFLVMGGPAATLDLNGTSQQFSGVLTDTTTPGSGGSIIGGVGSQLVINQDANNRTYAGTIGGSVNLVRSGPNTLTLVSPNNYTGTTLVNGGTLTLQSDATLSGTSSIDLNYASLTLDNTGLNDSANRINDAATLGLRGGTLNFNGRAQTASTETLGAVSAIQGFSTINSTIGGTGVNSTDLLLSSLSRPALSAATLNVAGTNLGTIGSAPRVTVTTLNGVATTNPAYSANGSGLTNNLVGAWAISGNEFLTYIPGLGLAPLNQTGAAQYDLTNTFVGGVSTDNVRLTATTNVPNGGSVVNAVSMTGSNIALNFATGTDTLNIVSGGLIGPNNNQNIGATVDSGRLTVGGLTPAANSDLYLYNRANTLTVNSRIIDNSNGGGSSVRAVLTASGGNINLVNINNSYTGGTVVNGGTVNLLASTAGSVIPAATVPANGLIINNATVTMGSATNTVAQQIAAANIVTMNGVGTLNLFGDNTLAGLVLNNNGGGNGNLQINTFSTATATGAGEFGVLTIGSSGIEVTSSNVASTAIIVGRTDFGATAKTVNVAPISANGQDVAPLQAAFAIQGITGTTGGITKTGNGVMQFNAQAHYSGPTTVNAGGIRSGVTFGGSRLSALTLNSGTHLNLNGATTVWGSLAGSGTVFNSSTTAATLQVGLDNTSTTFSGQLARFNDAVVNGVALQKIGTGTLSMTSGQAFASGSTGAITVSGGTLRYVDAGAAFPATAASGGGTFNLNNGGTLSLDNTGTANVNNRLGMNVAGTLNIQGGRLTINGSSSAATTETVTAFNVLNGGGRVELTADPARALTLAITTLNSANGNGGLVITGITGAASAAGVANLTMTTPNFLGTQGGAANGATTMSVRHDILADASVAGLGTGFLVRDSVTNNFRALGTASNGSAAPGELSPTFALPLTTDVDLVTAGNQAAGTLNVGLTGGTTSLNVSSVANTVTFSGTNTVNSGLGAAFGDYSPAGGLLGLTLSNAAASLTLAGATTNFNLGALGSTTTGNTLYHHVIAGGTLNVNGFAGIASATGVSNTAGLAKLGGGVMSLNRRAFFTGATTINNGTLRLNSGSNDTLVVAQTAGAATVSQVNLNGTGSVLDLMGRNQAIGALTSVNPLPGQGGTVQTTGGAATLTSTGGGTFGGVISGQIAFTRAGSNTTTLTSAQTYTGATIVRGGTLQLRDSGALASTAGLTLNYGTLNWDNFGLNPNGNPNPTRIAATNAVTLQGGSFTINGAGSTDTIATLNSVNVTGGSNLISTLPYINMGSTVQLTIGNLVRNTATKSGVVFNGFSVNNSTGANTLGGQGLTTNSNIFLSQINGAAFNASNLVNGLIGGWAVADGSTFATYDNTFGVVAMGNAYGGFTAPVFAGTDLSGALVATGNYSDGANRTLTTGNKTANSIRFAGATAAQTITPVSGTTYSIGVGFIANQGQSTTIAAVDATNTITGTGTDLFFYINQNTVAIQPAIIGSSSLISNGPATLSLRPTFASNTYSGGTFVNNGTTNLQAAGSFIAIPGNLTITNGAVTMSTTPNQIASTSVVTFNGGGIMTLANYGSAATQTFDSFVFNNEGGTQDPGLRYGTPTALSTVILSNASPITSTNNSLATTPTISTSAAAQSALQFSTANPVITVNDGLAETELNIAVPITQHASMTSLSKSGTGVLALSGASTFTAGFNLNQGGLMFGANSTGSPVVTSGPVGTGTLTIAGGTSLLSDGTARTITNATTVNGDFTFGGRVAGNGVTLSGAMNLGAAGRTITVDSPAVTSTISGAITSTATGTALTKAGEGTLVLSSATSNLGGAGVAVTGGILRNGIINAIPTASAVAVSAGAGYDLNGFGQTVDGISGAGFITNSANSAQTLTVSSTANSSTFAGVLTDNILAQSASRLNLTKAGAGTTLTLTGANTYSGVTNVSAGILSITNALALGTTANGTVVTSGGSLELQNNITVTGETLSIAGIGSASNGALRNLSGNNTFASTVTLTAAASIQSDAGLLTLDVPTGNAITATNQNVTFTGAGNTTVVDAIATGSGSLTKTGSGNLTLSGTNTYTGGTAINGTAGSVVTVNSAGALGTTGTISFGGGTLQYTANNTTDYSNRISTAASQAVSVDTNSQNVTFATALTSSGGSVNKQGLGTLTFTAANTYDAGTTVTGGRLLVNNTTGSGTGSGAVTVSNAGTILGGSGTIAGDLTVNAGGMIAPGSAANTAGTLTIGGSAVVINGSGLPETRLNFDFTNATGNVGAATFNTPDWWTSYSGSLLTGTNGQSNDLLNFTAATTNLTWNTGGKITLNQIGSAYTWLQGDVFNLLDWTTLSGGAIGGTFNSAVDFDLPTLGSGLAWDTSRFVTTGAIAVVPEPGRALLMLFGLMALSFRRRRQD